MFWQKSRPNDPTMLPAPTMTNTPHQTASSLALGYGWMMMLMACAKHSEKNGHTHASISAKAIPVYMM